MSIESEIKRLEKEAKLQEQTIRMAEMEGYGHKVERLATWKRKADGYRAQAKKLKEKLEKKKEEDNG